MAAVATLLRAEDGSFLVCDAVLDAQHEATCDVTEHAIEDGSSISDHVVRKPFSMSMTLVATQTPIYSRYPGTDGVSGLTPTPQSLSVRTTSQGRQTTELQIRKSNGQQLNVAAAISAVGGLLRKAVGLGDPTAIDGVLAKPAEPKPLTVTVLTTDTPQDRVGDFHQILLNFLTTATRLTVVFKGREYPDLVLTSVTRSDAAGQGGRATFPIQLRQVLTVETKQVNLPKVPAQKSKKDLGAKGGEYGPPLPPEPAARLTSTLASTADLATGG